MKTPMQELIEQFENRLSSLKEVQATANLETQDFLETKIEELEGCILSAELMLEKEEETIKKCIVMGMEFIPVDPSRYEEDSELIFNETFNTKEK